MNEPLKPLLPQLPLLLVEDAVRAALAEDLGRAGDITSDAIIAPEKSAEALLSARESGILCGMPLAEAAFLALDRKMSFEMLANDGDKIERGQPVARIAGNARAMLAAERVALNFLMHMSGIASYTALFQERIAHTPARICCTRKTVPGLRAFDKYAVKCGGGSSHRYGLDDAILIKDNHIAVCGSVELAIKRARAFIGHLVAIEVEVDTLDQLRQALAAQADVVLLDNMGIEMLAQAVTINRQAGSHARLEASGNVRIDTVAAIAETGVDYISTSKITMAAPTLDLGLDITIS
jgi:nicotinate-nucleotide pyrophosphorylase (carboxylating)